MNSGSRRAPRVERIRPSATVILWRRAPDLQVYLVERSMRTRFFPGYRAFPGGVVDEADGEGDAGRVAAAVRELREETSVRVDAAALVSAGRLVTPPFGPTRYDTSFFVAELPAGAQPQVDGVELVSGAWWTPAEALRRFAEEAMPVPPPTLAYLRLLQVHGAADKAAEAARATDGRPHHERFRIEIHPGVYVLPMRTTTLPPATTQNCYVLDSDPILVIDPGAHDAFEHAALFHHLDEMTRDGREILVLLTHHHPDHIGAVEAVQRRYGVRVMGSAATRDALPKHFVDGVVAEGHIFDVGVWGKKPWRVDVLHTPGHAPGHLAFRDTRFGAIFAGDLVSGVSTILIDPDEGSMADYLRSLERCAALDPPIVLPGHGPAMPRGAFHQVVEHRRMRERKVEDALGDEPQAVSALLPVVYADTPQEAWGLAELSLRSHLRHLAEQGKAVEEKGAWRRA